MTPIGFIIAIGTAAIGFMLYVLVALCKDRPSEVGPLGKLNFNGVASANGFWQTTEVCLCHDQEQCLRQLLAPRSLVVSGEERGGFSKEKRTEPWLESLGHQLVFVNVNPMPEVATAVANATLPGDERDCSRSFVCKIWFSQQ